MSAFEDVTRLAIDGDKGALDLVVRELQAHVATPSRCECRTNAS
jgi:hypothetical protein